MSELAAAVLAAGELICEFSDGYRKSLLAQMAGDVPRIEILMVYESLQQDAAEVVTSGRSGRKPVQVHSAGQYVHLVEPEGPSVRVTTLTGCTRMQWRGGEEICTRFSARHAWHFDLAARFQADAAFARLPSGSATGVCEPWKIE